MILKNARHELFAQAVATGKTADEAYQIAGFRAHRGNASRLRSSEIISARIAEIFAAASVKTEVTLESLQAEADAIQREAMRLGQLSAASGALKLKAVFAGLYVEKAENTNRNLDPAQLSDEELAEIARGPSPPAAPAVALDRAAPSEEDRIN